MTLYELQDLLVAARTKLTLYREQHSGQYIGGVEYTDLKSRLDGAIVEIAVSAAKKGGQSHV